MKKLIYVLAFLCVVPGQGIFAQSDKQDKSNNETEARLVQVFPKHYTSEIRGQGIDNLAIWIEKNKNSKGLIIVYCGKICQYGEVEAHIRGIKNKIDNRNYSVKDFAIIAGGYRENQETELWLIPQNACLPIPKSEIKIEDVKFKGIFKKKTVYYDCCDFD